jgi:hypothetical protein
MDPIAARSVSRSTPRRRSQARACRSPGRRISTRDARSEGHTERAGSIGPKRSRNRSPRGILARVVAGEAGIPVARSSTRRGEGGGAHAASDHSHHGSGCRVDMETIQAGTDAPPANSSSAQAARGVAPAGCVDHAATFSDAPSTSSRITLTSVRPCGAGTSGKSAVHGTKSSNPAGLGPPAESRSTCTAARTPTAAASKTSGRRRRRSVHASSVPSRATRNRRDGPIQ